MGREPGSRALRDGLAGVLAFMMLDADVVAVSPSTTYRVLKAVGRLDRWNRKPSKKGTGFVQPLAPHEHRHIDISYLNVTGTFCYLWSLLDGASRATGRRVHRSTGIISDSGPPFIAKDLKHFIRIAGMTHVRTAPYCPQSNGKIERWHKTLNDDAIPFASLRRVRLRRLGMLSRGSLLTTTACTCTVPSATSRQTTSSPVVATRSCHGFLSRHLELGAPARGIRRPRRAAALAEDGEDHSMVG